MGIVCNKDDTSAWHTASPYGSRAEAGANGLNGLFGDQGGEGDADPYKAAPAPRRNDGYDPGKMVYAPPTMRKPQMEDQNSRRFY